MVTSFLLEYIGNNPIVEVLTITQDSEKKKLIE